MRRTVFVITLWAALSAACGGSGAYIQKGVEQYNRQNYRGALYEWNELNGSESSMDQETLARYLVYRGLTHYHLDQRPFAIVFLSRGKDAYARGSSVWLSSEIVSEMNKALANLQAAPVAPASASSPSPSSSAAAPAAPASPPPTAEARVPVKPAASSGSPASAKTAAPGAGPPKTSSPSTRTSPAGKSTSPK
jgi:hypothetical protein